MKRKIVQQPHKYSEDDYNYINQNINRMNYEELAGRFSKKYNKPFTAQALSKWATNHGIKKTIRCFTVGRRNRENVHFTEEQLLWLRKNDEKCTTWECLTDEFNKYHNTSLSPDVIRSTCAKRLGIVHGSSTIHKPQYVNPIALPIGSERTEVTGRVYVKVSDKKLPCGDSGNWKKKTRVVWESYYGKLEDDEFIVHLNGDFMDFRIENLYKVRGRSELAAVTPYIKSKDESIMKTACLYAQLRTSINEVQALQSNGSVGKA